MKKIVLLCSAGMSTSLLVTKMREAAAAENYECEINAYPMSEASSVGKMADVILLGPQVRFNMKKIQALCPEVPVDAIEMRMYGKMDGKSVLAFARSKISE